MSGFVDRLARREISAEELVRECLRNFEARELSVQAWEIFDAEGALREARRIDALPSRPPLCGLPVAVKDLIDTADFPTFYGSNRYRAKGHRPARDAACVRALREAGAVVLGKTVTTEFAVYTAGKTRNPHDAARTPGGSSSGSAAAVAAGMAPVALGTQTAASIVRPASFCGVVGWKPTHGTLPLEGVHPLAPSLDTVGFLVRELDDVAALLGAAMPAPRGAPRLLLCSDEIARADPATQEAIAQAAAALLRSGAHVSELQLDDLADAQIAIMGAEAAISLRDEPADSLSPRLREFLREGAGVSPERLRAAHEQAQQARRKVEAALANADALLAPAAAGEAPLGLDATGDPHFGRAWSLLGTPSVSLPVLKGPAGLPVGLQLVGARGRDLDLLAAAAWVQQHS